MIIHKGYRNLRLKAPVVTMGIFDGVHLGHRHLLDSLISRARESSGESVVITFDPHPRMVLSRTRTGLSFLSTIDEKTALLRQSGLDHLIIIRFTASLSRMKACDFVEKILVDSIGTSYLVMGHDHHFGRGGEGDYKTVENCAVSAGFMVEQVTGYPVGGEIISSSMIREALLTGRVEEACQWLGYDYSVAGKVIEGRKIGRKIGFPTANIDPADKYKLIPGNGVYAVEVQIGGDLIHGMLSIGTNPTVNHTAGERSVEVNMFNFKQNIYGNEIRVIFRYRLRDEKKFRSTRELALQMEKDREMALRLLGTS